MRHLNSGSKLGRQPAHRRATLRNLVTNVIEKERITTTITRAKAARPLGRADHHSRQARFAARAAAGGGVSDDARRPPKNCSSDIAPRFADRAGGYTRIIHAGFRIGDGAELAILEMLGSKLKKKEKKEKERQRPEEEAAEEARRV